MKKSFVYIITNKYNTVLYIGVTNNLERRISEHKQKLVKGFSYKYNLDKLVWFQEFNSIKEAIANEKKIKGWVRKRKIELIESTNHEWKEIVTGSFAGAQDDI